MKRQPLVSSLGILITLCFLVGLGLHVKANGGKAFSPGGLSAKQRPDISLHGFKSHADFEGQCNLCHAPLETNQDVLCLQCHENIAQQIIQRSGTHSLIENVNHCASCHHDHRGKDYDPTASAFNNFNHENARFSLALHQVNFDATPIRCSECHDINITFAVSESNCANCHAILDADFVTQHTKDFAKNCLVCHDGRDRFTNFNHQSTGYVLEGKHQAVRCLECHHINLANFPQQYGGTLRMGFSSAVTLPSGNPHPEDPFKNAPTDCAGCHEEPSEHAGIFSNRCDDCHTPQGWLPARLDGELFNHATRSGFSLGHHRYNDENELISCMDCHASDLKTFSVQTCINCHGKGEERAAFLQQHEAKYNQNCLECHDGVDRMDNFNHANFFPLEGKHVELDCSQCHVEKKFASTPAECVQCHAEPAIHAGFFGLKCQSCHTAQAWSPAKLHVHNFPLDHGNRGETDCKICHPRAYTEYTCFGCHDHQPDSIAVSHQNAGISQEVLPDCAACHPDGRRENKP